MAFYAKQDFLFHIDTTLISSRSSSESEEPPCRLLEIEANAVIKGAGNAGWSRTRPKLVCYEAWWLRSNNMLLLIPLVLYVCVVCSESTTRFAFKNTLYHFVTLNLFEMWSSWTTSGLLSGTLLRCCHARKLNVAGGNHYLVCINFTYHRSNLGQLNRLKSRIISSSTLTQSQFICDTMYIQFLSSTCG